MWESTDIMESRNPILASKGNTTSIHLASKRYLSTTRRIAMPSPITVDRETFQKRVDQLRIREKEHTREGDSIAAARRRLPMVEVDPATPLVGAAGFVSLLDTFEGRTQLFVSYHMWHNGLPSTDQCEGCTFNTGHALELTYLHSRNVTFAVFCQGSYDESNRYREFMGWDMPWYSVPE